MEFFNDASQDYKFLKNLMKGVSRCHENIDTEAISENAELVTEVSAKRAFLQLSSGEMCPAIILWKCWPGRN